MPWKVTRPMEERNKFVRRLLAGDSMASVCREFGISRKTGHKIYNRFLQRGEAGLEDLTRRPKRLANLMNPAVADWILELKGKKPTWGAPKLRELLMKKHPGTKAPAISTIHALLDRKGLVTKRSRRSRHKATGTYLSNPQRPNDLWCTDFKGQFALQDRSLCYPLTVSDFVSRKIIEIDAMERISEDEAKAVFTTIFKEYGLPDAIRSDNGVPFSSRSIFGLSKLSVWWLRLGIQLERIRPGNPQDNGRHERMHKTLKLSTTKPPAKNILAQQEKFDAFIEEFNSERPHEGLQMKTPNEVYRKSRKAFPHILPDLDYLSHEGKARVYTNGAIHVPHIKRMVHVGAPLTGEMLGYRQIDDELWQLDFMDYELGFYDTQGKFTAAAHNPFSLGDFYDNQVLPMSPE